MMAKINREWKYNISEIEDPVNYLDDGAFLQKKKVNSL